MTRKVAVFSGILILIFLFSNILYELPRFGDFDERGITNYYLWHGLHETGSANIVNSIIWDFRGFDTLGEETVLFSAAMGVFLVLRGKKYGCDNKDD